MKKAKCGHDTATVGFDRDDGQAPYIRSLELTCTKCKSRTHIFFPKPKPDLVVSFPSDEGGTDLGIFTVSYTEYE